jgi:hypothetical protein
MALGKHAISELSPKTEYAKKELNLIIATYENDTALLRRTGIEHGILERDRDGDCWVNNQ